MMHRAHVRLVWLALALAACDAPVGPPRPSYPTANWDEAFSLETSAETPHDSFEARVAAVQQVEPPQNASRVRRVVALAGTAHTRVSTQSHEWSWASDEHVTIVQHHSALGLDAVVYFERYSDLAATAPSAEAQRFVASVVPDLASKRFLPFSTSVVAGDLGRRSGVAPDVLIQLAQELLSSTAGRGWDIAIDAETWTGWKYLERLESGGEIRFGRVATVWGGRQPSVPRPTAALTSAVPAALRDLLGGESTSQTDRHTSSPRPATLWLGSVSFGANSGVHFAALCSSAPTCTVSEPLRDMLRGIEDGVPSSANSGASDLREMARSAGIPLVERSRWLGFAELLRRLVESRDALAAQDGSGEGESE